MSLESAKRKARKAAGVGGPAPPPNGRVQPASKHWLPLEKRGAHYTCYAVLSDPAGDVRAESEGACRGRILTEPAGSGGFGYDPLFEIIELHHTFGEVAPAVKSVLSHRSRAIRQLVPQIVVLTDRGEWR